MQRQERKTERKKGERNKAQEGQLQAFFYRPQHQIYEVAGLKQMLEELCGKRFYQVFFTFF